MRLLLAIVVLASNLLSGQSTVRIGQEYTFHGRIHNKYPITLVFQQYENGKVKGIYYYDKIGTPIELEGHSHSGGYELKTTAFGFNESFSLKIFHNELMGKWRSTNKSFSVNVDRQTNPTRFLYIDEKVTATELGIDGDWPTGEIQLQLPIPNGADTIEQAILIHSFNIMNNLQLGFENASAFRVTEEMENGVWNLGNQIKMQMKRFADTFLMRYKRDMKSRFKQTNGDVHSLNNVTFHRTVRTGYNSERYQVLYDSYYEFTGGAHGLYRSGHNSIDKKRGRWAGITDFIPEKELESTIPKLMNTYYRKANGIPTGESLKKHSLWIDDFSGLGGDTYITDLGLHTSFGIYEIAPYSEGEINVFIPMSELKKLSKK